MARDIDTANAPTNPLNGPPLFEARNVTKSFGEVTANKNISLAIQSGEILALLGENGAGKSTLVKMIDGVLRPDTGSFIWRGKPVAISSPSVAKRIGIGMIFQHFSSFEALTVLENLALALPRRSMRTIRRDIAGVSERYGLALTPNRRVEQLSAGEKQRVEIARALLQKPELLILDEPTSVLTPQESENLFSTLKTLSADGMAMIYISHRLTEIKELCDSAVVLRQGEIVGNCDPKTTSVPVIAEMMIGKTADPIRRAEAYVGNVRLKVENLTISMPEGTSLDRVTFTARRGEIMGIAGIAGEGQEALFAALSGERRTPAARSIAIDSKPIGAMGPTERRRLGLAFAPEQRLGHAAVADLPLSANLRLTRHGIQALSKGKLTQKSRNIRETYDVRGAKNDPKAATLSGGNLQKFVIGRELERNPDVFVVAQPTWGVDAGAASFIRNELIAMTRRGGTVIVISQDLDEIFQIADRVAVLHRGTLSDTYPIDDMTPEKIGLLMAGEDPSLADAPPAQNQSQAQTRGAEIAGVTAPPPTTPDVPRPPAPPSPPPVRTANPQTLTMGGSVSTAWTPQDQLGKGGLPR